MTGRRSGSEVPAGSGQAWPAAQVPFSTCKCLGFRGLGV